MHWEPVSSSALSAGHQPSIQRGAATTDHISSTSPPAMTASSFSMPICLEKNSQHIVRTLLWFSVLFWLKCGWREKEGEEERGGRGGEGGEERKQIRSTSSVPVGKKRKTASS